MRKLDEEINMKGGWKDTKIDEAKELILTFLEDWMKTGYKSDMHGDFSAEHLHKALKEYLQ